jgi:hypothetical protein
MTANKSHKLSGQPVGAKAQVFMQFSERLSPAAFLHDQMGGLDRLPESDLGLGHMEGSA